MKKKYNQTPIILNLYSKENIIKKKYIFVGNIPDKLCKEFIKIEKTFKINNQQSKIFKNLLNFIHK
jgi:hypothetical protein